ncbi:hypothetical protein SFUMM280S_06041 [Streptomyces fumanus]
MRRSSVACASRAAARVAVSSATRSDRSVPGPADSSRRPGFAWSRARAGPRPRMMAVQPRPSSVTEAASGQVRAVPNPSEVLVASAGATGHSSGKRVSRTAAIGR